jgi:hypothetical protein
MPQEIMHLGEIDVLDDHYEYYEKVGDKMIKLDIINLQQKKLIDILTLINRKKLFRKQVYSISIK